MGVIMSNMHWFIYVVIILQQLMSLVYASCFKLISNVSFYITALIYLFIFHIIYFVSGIVLNL